MVPYIVFAAISQAQLNLDVDSRKRCYPSNTRQTIQIDGRACGLSIKPSIATNANE